MAKGSFDDEHLKQKCRSCQQGLVGCAQVLFFLYSPHLNCPEPMLFRFFALHLKGGYSYSTFRVLQNVGGKQLASKSVLISHLCGQYPRFHSPSLYYNM